MNYIPRQQRREEEGKYPFRRRLYFVKKRDCSRKFLLKIILFLIEIINIHVPRKFNDNSDQGNVIQ